MNIEQLCCNLELATKLRDLGYPQEGSLFYWVNKSTKDCKLWRTDWVLQGEGDYKEEKEMRKFIAGFGKINHYDKIAAPTAGELGEWLPNRDKQRWFTEQVSGLTSWICRLWECDVNYHATFGENFPAKTESDARALTAIHRLESGTGKGENK